MTDREKNLGIRVGDTVIHCNREFTIMDIRVDESMEGMEMYIKAVDPHMADKEQQKAIKMNQTGEQILDMVRKVMSKGLNGLEDMEK